MSLWERAVEPYIAALEHGQMEYEAALPEVIGAMPVEERAVFANWISPIISEPDMAVDYGRRHGYPLEDIVRLLPGTFHLMLDDVREVTKTGATIDIAIVQSKETPAGRAPREAELHLDYVSQDSSDVERPLYIVSSHQPTVFYEGPVRLHTPRTLPEVDPTSLPTDPELWSPKPFEIVRIGPATVHGSPVFDETARRTFMEVGTRLIK